MNTVHLKEPSFYFQVFAFDISERQHCTVNKCRSFSLTDFGSNPSSKPITHQLTAQVLIQVICKMNTIIVLTLLCYPEGQIKYNIGTQSPQKLKFLVYLTRGLLSLVISEVVISLWFPTMKCLLGDYFL